MNETTVIYIIYNGGLDESNNNLTLLSLHIVELSTRYLFEFFNKENHQ